MHSSEESWIGVPIEHRNLLKLKAVTQEDFVGSIAVIAQFSGGGIVGIAQTKNLLRIAGLLLVLHGVLKTHDRRYCVPRSPSHPTPQHLVPHHIHVDVSNGCVQIRFSQNVAAQHQIIPIQLVIVTPHEIEVAGGLDAQLSQSDLGHVRSRNTAVERTRFADVYPQVDVSGAGALLVIRNRRILKRVVNGYPLISNGLAEHTHGGAEAQNGTIRHR